MEDANGLLHGRKPGAGGWILWESEYLAIWGAGKKQVEHGLKMVAVRRLSVILTVHSSPSREFGCF
jgi:hypothetical protein